MQEVANYLLRKVLYQVTTPQKVIPNLSLGIMVSLVVAVILFREHKAEPLYIRIHKKKMLFFSLLICVWTILTGPLPLGGGFRWVKLLSYSVLLIVLLVTGYMDEHNHSYRQGYMLIGIFLQAIFVLIGLLSRQIQVKNTLLMIFMCFLILGCHLLRAYTYGDMMLLYLCYACLWILGDTIVLYTIVLTMFVAFLTDVLRNVWFIPGKIRRKEPIRFPFVTHIFIGVTFSIFFVHY